jgi:V/A-type H+-transporting ATPase subunit D
VARLALSKSSLSKQQTQLKTFERFLPSLDLKRRQLMGERNKAVRRLRHTREEIKSYTDQLGERLPMVSDREIKVSGLVSVKDITLGKENIVGTHLPTLEHVEVEVADYPLLSKPHWVDNMVEELRIIMELKLRAQVDQQRLDILEAAVRTITQRVNLFDKVLIPRTRRNIKQIKIYLADAERAAVINSKISKRKNAVEEEAATP